MRVRTLAMVAAVLSLSVIASAQGVLGNHSDPDAYAVHGSTAYFRAFTPSQSYQIWKTDGTVAGTQVVTQLAANAAISPPFLHNGKVMFFANTDAHRLYETDGTAAGTTVVLTLSTSGQVTHVGSAGTYFLFIVKQPSLDIFEIWRSDGTAAGTTQLKTFATYYSPSLVIAGTTAFFTHQPYSGSRELHTTDGTVAGTRLLVSDVGSTTTWGNNLLYSRWNGLWLTDGTTAGTQLSSAAPSTVATFDTFAIFGYGGAIYRTDGTKAGTTSVMTGLIGSTRWALRLNDTQAVVVQQGSSYAHFYVTDGTAAGTTLVKGANLYIGGVAAKVGNQILFGADDYQSYSSYSAELWRFDGTSNGLARLTELSSDYYSSGLRSAKVFGEKLLFTGWHKTKGIEPWISDGTEAGTFLLGNLNPEATLRGKVTNAKSGAALTKTKVQLYEGYSWLIHEVPVESDGTWVIEGLRNGTYRLRTKSTDGHIDQLWKGKTCGSDYCDTYYGTPITVNSATEQTGFDFALTLGAKFTGRVTNLQGAVVNGMTVHAGSQYGNSTASTYLNSDGTYTLGPLPAGSYIVWLTQSYQYSGQVYPGIGCSAGCTSASGSPVALGEGESRIIDFVAYRHGTIKGKVLSSTPGVTVTDYYVNISPVSSNASYLYASRNGNEFEVQLRDGQYVIEVTSWDSKHVGSFYSTSGCKPCTRAQATVITNNIESTQTGFDIVLPYSSSTIKGRITNLSTGAPISGLTVFLTSAAGGSTYTWTDPTGAYSFSRFAGTYTISPSSYGALQAPAPRTVTVGDNETATVDFQLAPTGMITGRVTDAVTNAGIANHPVRLVTPTNALVAQTTTGSDGTFRFNGSIGLTYYVLTTPKSPYIGELYNGSGGIPCEGCTVTSGKKVIIPAAGSIANINFRLDRGGTITGRVTDRVTTRSMPNVAITISGTNLPTRNVVSTSSGTFTIGMLLPGTYTLKATIAGWKTVQQSVSVVLATSTPVTLALDAACTNIISPASLTLAAAGGPSSTKITSSCAWSGFTTSSWITSATWSGTGTGSFAFTAAPNTSRSARTAYIVFPGKLVTVKQNGVQ